MNDNVKAAVEWLRTIDKDDRDYAEVQVLLAHLDSEPQRIAAAREEQREALGINRWPVLIPFLAAMARKLDANKPKKGGREGWQNDDPQALLARVREEVGELARAVAASSRVDVLHEAADVANMAMMVADSVGAIRDAPLTSTPLADENAALRDDLHNERKSNAGLLERAEKAEAERNEAVKALRALRREVSAHLTGRDSEPGEFEKAWQQACAVLAKYPEGT